MPSIETLHSTTSIYLSIYLSISLSIYLSIYLSTYLHIYIYIYISIHRTLWVLEFRLQTFAWLNPFLARQEDAELDAWDPFDALEVCACFRRLLGSGVYIL